MRSFAIKETDKALSEALIDKINNLTKPKGSLGLLEKTAHQIGLIQQTLSPELRNPQNIIFAADHGIVKEGVSFSAPEVTAQMIFNFIKRGEFRGNGNSQYFFFFHVDDLPNGYSVE